MKRTSHKSFNPFEFSTSTDNSEYTESESKEEGDKILTKGDGNFYYLDFNKVEKEVQELLKNPNTKISDLQGADKKRFDYLRLAAQMFYDTDKYKCFYDRVTKYCKTVPDPMPGTIGGYVCGCLASQNFIEPMCTSVCAIGEDVDLFACVDSRADYAQSRAVTAGCRQRPRVAVRQDGTAIGNQGRSMASHGFVEGEVFFADEAGLGNQGVANLLVWLAAQHRVEPLHAIDGPEQVHRGWTRPRQFFANRREVVIRIFCSSL